MADTFGFKLGVEGEKEFKKALTDINGQFKVLGSEMKLATSQFDKNEQSVESLTAKNEVLTKQIGMQKDKVETLRSALKNASDSFGENDSRTQKWVVALNNAEAELNGMNREMAQNEKTIDELGDEMKQTADQTDKLGIEVKNAGDKADKADDKFNRLGSVISGAKKAIAVSAAAVGAAAIATGKALADMTVDAAASADSILTLSAQTGIATDKIQEYQYAAELVDVSTETLTKSMAKQIKSMKAAQDGTKLSVEAYQKLGVNVLNLDGTLRNSDDVYWEIIDALGKMDNETERDALAMQILGKSAQDLNPLIEAGADRMKELAAEAHAAGYVMNGETLAAFGALDDNIQKLKVDAVAAKNALGQAFLPFLTKLSGNGITLLEKFTKKLNDANGDAGKMIDAFSDMIPEMLDVLEDYAPLIGETVGKIAAAIVKSIPSIIAGLVSALGGMVTGLTESLGIETRKAEEALTISAQNQQRKLAELQTAYDEMCNKYGETSQAAQDAAHDLSLATHDFASSSKQTITELYAEIDEAVASHNALVESYEKSVSAADEQAISAEALTRKLETLMATEEMTVGTKEQILSVVSALNEAIPNLNLVYDDQTNSLNTTTAAIYNNISALKAQLKLEASRGSLVDLFAEEDTLKIQYDDAFAAYMDTKNKWEALRAEYANPLKYRSGASISEQGELSQKLRETEEAFDEVAASYEENQRYIKSISESIQRYAEEAASATIDFNEEVDDSGEKLKKTYVDTSNTAKKAAEEEAKAAEKAAEATQKAHDTITDAVVDAASAAGDALKKLENDYDSAFSSAKNSLQGQGGMFGYLKTEATKNLEKIAEAAKATEDGVTKSTENEITSIGDMVKALESQARYAEEYQSNLEKVAGYGLDKQLLAELTDGSEQSKAALATIVSEVEANRWDIQKGFGTSIISEVNKAYAEAEAARASAADTVAEIQTGLDRSALESARDALSEFTAGGVMTDDIETAMYDLGLNMDQAIAWGITDGAEAIFAALSETDLAKILSFIGFDGALSGFSVDTGADSTITHTGTLRVEGVNNEGELVAATEIIVDDIITRLQREARLA